MYENSEIVKSGVFYYANEVPCDIRIFRHQMRYGSGDIFDSKIDQEDIVGDFYYVEYGSTSERGKYVSLSAANSSLEEAILNAHESIASKIEWEN